MQTHNVGRTFLEDILKKARRAENLHETVLSIGQNVRHAARTNGKYFNFMHVSDSFRQNPLEKLLKRIPLKLHFQ